MSEPEEDPWASLRDASRKPEAGRFAYNDAPNERAQASVWEWIKFIIRVDFVGWLQKQLPLAKKSLDSSYYLGINRRKKATRDAVKVILGREPDKELARTPVIIFGRRIGVPGLLLASFTLIVVFAIIRNILNF